MKKSYFLPLLLQYSTTTTALEQFKVSIPVQYMAVAGTGAGAEIMAKGGAGAENK